GGVIVPEDDIDALIGQLVGNDLHARTPHADAGADRIDAPDVGLHHDLGAGTRITRSGLDLDDFLSDFRHFNLEQLDQHAGRGTAEEQLWTTRFGAHVEQQGADAIARAEVLARDHLVARQQSFRVVAQVDDHTVAGHFLYR